MNQQHLKPYLYTIPTLLAFTYPKPASSFVSSPIRKRQMSHPYKSLCFHPRYLHRSKPAPTANSATSPTSTSLTGSRPSPSKKKNLYAISIEFCISNLDSKTPSSTRRTARSSYPTRYSCLPKRVSATSKTQPLQSIIPSKTHGSFSPIYRTPAPPNPALIPLPQIAPTRTPPSPSHPIQPGK